MLQNVTQGPAPSAGQWILEHADQEQEDREAFLLLGTILELVDFAGSAFHTANAVGASARRFADGILDLKIERHGLLLQLRHRHAIKHNGLTPHAGRPV